MPAVERVADSPQEHRHAVRWYVGFTAEQLAGRGEKGGRRPTAQVVALVDIRSSVGIYPDGYVPLLDETAHDRIPIRCAGHFRTPPTPRGSNA